MTKSNEQQQGPTISAKPEARERSPRLWRWIKRVLLALLVLLLLVVLALIGAFHWLTRTQSGAEFALGQAQGPVPTLSWAAASGNLRDGLVLEQLTLAPGGAELDIERVEVAAELQLIGGLELRVRRLIVRGADILLPPPAPASESDEAVTIPDLASPVPVIIEQLELSRVRVLTDRGQPALVELDRLALTARVDETLVLETLELRAPQGELSASGQAGLSAPHRLDLRLNAQTRLEGLPEHRIALTLNGPLSDLDLGLDSTGPVALSGTAQLRGLPSLETLVLELSGRVDDWPGLAYGVRDVELGLNGGLEDWTAELGAIVEGPELPDNRIRLEASGSLESARLAALRVETLNGVITAQGQASWADALAASLSVGLEQLDLTALYPDLPAQARLNGALDLAVEDESIVLESLTLRAPPTTLSLQGSGRYDPARDALALDLIWQDFMWPPVLDGSDPLVESQRGEIRLTGRLSDWRAELDALLQVPDRPEAQVQAELQGSQVGARLEQLSLDAASAGRMQISGSIDWQPGLRGELTAALFDVDPSEFLRQLPGQLSADIDIAIEAPDTFRLVLNRLDGTLRGQPVSGGGQVNWQAAAPEAGRLELALGDNRLQLDSRDGERWTFEARGDALDQLWPGLSGVLEAEGSILPADAELIATATVRAAGLDDITLNQLDLSADLRWQEPTRADVVLTLTDLDLNPWERVDQLELTLQGRCRSHRFGLNFSAQRASLDLAGEGQWPECFRGGERWDAAIERLFLGDTLAGDWQLSAPLRFQVTPAGARIEPACLAAAGSSPGAVCLDAATLAATGEASSASVSLDDVPMDLLLLPLDPTVSLSSALSGELQTGWTAGQGLDRLAGHLDMSDGAVVPLGAERALLDIDGLRLNLTPSNGGVLAELSAQFEGSSSLTGAVGIDDLRQPANSTINGNLQLDLPDIGVFNRAVAELDSIGGRLEGEMAIRGRLGAPQLEGQARLVDGSLQHAPLGLDISDMQFELTGSNLQARLTGQMQSGEGSLAIDGGLRPNGDAWVWELSSRGDQFSLASVDWLTLAISPDLSLSGEGRRIEIDGDIAIDRLLAGLPPGRASQVTASEDVIVLGETEEQEGTQALIMSGRLGIDLGERSRLKAVGLETQLAGSVELLWDGSGAMPSSRGIILLPEGTFESYGQTLEIEDGEIVLSNQPITNPRLDIQAVRDIFGDPQVERAGVSIRGNAQSPEIRLFTDPPTSEEKALAYVVTGADFDHAGGQGAVNVGFYLLPKLFVSYGIGLFESGNVLSGRYELSRRWGVRVVSGERDTGVDMSYAIDR
jgi:translocation and assembly module TamB